MWTNRPNSLLDHLVGELQQRLRHGEAERLGGSQVNDQIEFGRQLNGQITGFRSFESAIYIEGRTSKQVEDVSPVGYQSAFGRK